MSNLQPLRYSILYTQYAILLTMIAIDGNEANVSQRVGSNVYAYRLLEGLSKKYPKKEFQVYLKSTPVEDFPEERKHWKYRVFGPGKLWTQWRLPLDLYAHSPKPDIFFTPGHYAPRFSPVPTVVSILDLSFLYFPEAFQPRVLQQLKSWTEYSARQASHILTISEHSKKDIVKEYGIDPEKITVTYLGSNIDTDTRLNKNSLEKIKKQHNIKTKYFVFVGTRQPKKNLDKLITAFKKLQEKERNISLVIVGKVWHQFAESETSNGNNIIFTGYLSDKDLPQLLMGAEAFVFPSLYEGFGMPVLEAMSLGVPVLASNTSSIPEITGKSPLLFNPTKEKEIQKQLETVLRLSEQKRKKLIREGKIRARNFSWDKCVEETMGVLERVKSGK